jgi:DNA-binding MarR family transcriptional regulator
MEQSVFNLDVQNTNVEFRIVAALERLSEAFRVLLWNEAKILNISPIQIQILVFLKFHALEKCKVSYLAQEFNMTKATISDAVKVMLQKGLIDNAPNRFG